MSKIVDKWFYEVRNCVVKWKHIIYFKYIYDKLMTDSWEKRLKKIFGTREVNGLNINRPHKQIR